jgi:hypothetical protein
VAQTIVGGNEQLVVRVRDLERRNKALDAKVTELHRQVHELEATAHPECSSLARAAAELSPEGTIVFRAWGVTQTRVAAAHFRSLVRGVHVAQRQLLCGQSWGLMAVARDRCRTFRPRSTR